MINVKYRIVFLYIINKVKLIKISSNKMGITYKIHIFVWLAIQDILVKHQSMGYEYMCKYDLKKKIILKKIWPGR